MVFRNVEELQKKNAELLGVVREMSGAQEKAEAQLVEEKTAELKAELDSVRTEVEELREARRRQEVLADNLIVQRDMYKSMAEAKETAPPPATSGMAPPTATSTPGAPLSGSRYEIFSPTFFHNRWLPYNQARSDF